MAGDVKEDSVEEVCFFSREGLFLCLGDIAGRGAKSPYIRILLHDMGSRIRGMIESIGKEEECGHDIRMKQAVKYGLIDSGVALLHASQIWPILYFHTELFL